LLVVVLPSGFLMPQTPFDSEWVSKGGFPMHVELMTVKDAKDSLQGVVLAISAKTERRLQYYSIHVAKPYLDP
jgi:hypothetical protein